MILENLIFGEPLQVKKEIELAESKRREDYFAEILESISDESGREWLRSILEEKKEGYLLITQLYKESPGGIEEHSNVCNDRDCKIESVSR